MLEGKSPPTHTQTPKTITGNKTKTKKQRNKVRKKGKYYKTIKNE